MARLVDNPQIKSAELLTPLPLHFHAYVWPFAIIWPIFLRYFLTPELYEKHIQSSEWTFVWCGTIITLQSLVWLSTNWSVDLKGSFTAAKAKTVQEADLIKLIPIANAGAADICKIEKEQVRTQSNSITYPPRSCLDIWALYEGAHRLTT
jgi:manganese-transporting P-type ATPase